MENRNEDEQSDPVYYYSRERRLSRASPEVQKLHEEGSLKSGPKGGLIRSLFSNRANAFLLFSILIICFMFYMYARTTANRSLTLGENTLIVEVSAEVSADTSADEGFSVLSIKKTAPKSGAVYLGPVDIMVSPVIPQSEGSGSLDELPVFRHKIIFNPLDSELFSVILPFTEDEFFISFRAGEEQKNIRVKAAGGR